MVGESTPLTDALLQVFDGLDEAAAKALTSSGVEAGEAVTEEGDTSSSAASALRPGHAASAGAVRGALASLGSALGGRFALGEMEDAADALLVILGAIDEEVAKIGSPEVTSGAGATSGVAKMIFGTTVAEYSFCDTCRRRWSAARCVGHLSVCVRARGDRLRLMCSKRLTCPSVCSLSPDTPN